MDVLLDNFIESQYQNLYLAQDTSYAEVYRDFKDSRLITIFATFHFHLIGLFRSMNSRLPSQGKQGYYLAQDSRDLLYIIKSTLEIQQNLQETEFDFSIPEPYSHLYRECLGFLKNTGGSLLPEGLAPITLPYKIKLFVLNSSTQIKRGKECVPFSLKHLGEGSYAHVYTYHDDYYNKDFVLKRAKKTLSLKELERFKQEFTTMQSLKSPYIVEVYKYNEDGNEYIMEKMDFTLEQYINHNIQKLDLSKKKSIIRQIYRAFDYIHSKGLLHRDISPKNILLNEYEDNTLVVKIADFGLVHIPDSILTTINTEFKGYFNDPILQRIGFNAYSSVHEIYALTCITGFILTGRTNFNDLKGAISKLVEKGLQSDTKKRYKSVLEMEKCLNSL